MGQRIEIGTAVVAEAASVRSVHERAARHWPEDRASLDADPAAIPDPEPEIAAGRIRVARVGGRLVGFTAAGARDAGLWELTGLFVEPELIGSGIGRALVADVRERAASAGAVALEVTGNENARGFYEKLGFEVVGAVGTRFGPALRLRVGLEAA